MEITQRYVDKYGPYVGPQAFALDLMRGDPATFKAGYTVANAALATQEAWGLSDLERRELELYLHMEPGIGCRWFARCDGLAEVVLAHPAFPDGVPTCLRCAAWVHDQERR